MPAVTYFHAAVQARHGLANWEFPEDALQEPVEVPTTRIRVLEGGQQLQGEIVALGNRVLTFKLLPESPGFPLYGAGSTLQAPYDSVILGEPTVVRPTDGWIEAWCDPRHTTVDIVQARRAMLAPAMTIEGEKWIEVREIDEQGRGLAFLCAFHRFNSPRHGVLTHDTLIDMPAQFGDLKVVSGPALEERFSLTDAVQAARDICAQRAYAKTAPGVSMRSR